MPSERSPRDRGADAKRMTQHRQQEVRQPAQDSAMAAAFAKFKG